MKFILSYLNFVSIKNCAVAVVGKDTPFTVLDDGRVGTYLTAIEGDERAPQAQDDTIVIK